MKRLAYLLFVMSLLGATACVTSIPVKIRRAPELNLIGVKSLHVEPFAVSGNLNMDLADTGGGIVGAVADIGLGAGVNKLAERKHKDLQSQHVDGLKSVIVGDGYYQVTDTGASDAVLKGALVYDVTDRGEDSKVTDKVDGKDVERDVYILTRTAKVTVRVNVTGKDGKVIGGTEVEAQAVSQVTKNSRDDARDAVDDWDVLVRKAITDSQSPTLQKIAPYFVTEQRTLAKGDSDVIKEANKAAAKGEWAAAAKMWTDAGKAGTGKDKVAATYNLGVYAEVEGRLEDALKLFKEVQSTSGQAKYATDVARVETRMSEEAKIAAARQTETEESETSGS